MVKDCDKKILADNNGEWIRIQIPFDDFELSYGQGSRYSDGALNLKNIAAYEINLVSDAGKNPKGMFLVDSLRTYK
ncbi:MAG TPA: hypothetical protein PKW80_00670 [Bacteroidales bacterium]|nr:hypothetical protein [Bacteroidales bacterium]